MELSIVILGLFLLGVHNAVSLFEDDDFRSILDQDGSKQTTVQNLKKGQSLPSDDPESIAVTFHNTAKCQQPMDVGPCRREIPRWYYDDSLKMCRQFVFGGCRGNANNFYSEAECNRECAPEIGGDTGIPPNPASKSNICAEKEFVCSKSLIVCIPVSFVCDGDFDCPQGEDEDDDECRNHQCPPDMFRCPSGRCLLQSRVCNGQNDCSETEASDEQNCTTSPHPPPPRPENAEVPSTAKCQQPMDVGPCRAVILKWYYDNSLNMCLQFTYGGCSGNGNRFGSEEDCLHECGALGPPVPQMPILAKCQQPMDVGPCRAELPKWYYENSLNMCLQFTYGGCSGNGNRFGSEEDCLHECGALGPPVPQMPILAKCQQPMDVGPCRAEFPKWYYDNSFNMCLPFTYGGCGGNDNRFATEAECRGQCVERINEPPPNTTEQQNREQAAIETTPKVPMNKTCRQRDDELETFGRYVASSLRKLNEKVAINAQDDIQRILSKYKLRNLKTTSS